MNVLELDEQINRLTRFLFQTLLVEVKIYEPRHSISYKITKRPAKTQISLRIHTVWSGCADWSESSIADIKF